MFRELAELIRDLTDSRADDIEHSKADLTKAQEKLDYELTVSLKEGLERTIEWWQCE